MDDGYGVLVRHESRDFLILAADLVLDGEATPSTARRPDSGDAGQHDVRLRGDGPGQGTVLALQRSVPQDAADPHQAG